MATSVRACIDPDYYSPFEHPLAVPLQLRGGRGVPVGGGRGVPVGGGGGVPVGGGGGVNEPLGGGRCGDAMTAATRRATTARYFMVTCGVERRVLLGLRVGWCSVEAFYTNAAGN